MIQRYVVRHCLFPNMKRFRRRKKLLTFLLFSFSFFFFVAILLLVQFHDWKRSLLNLLIPKLPKGPNIKNNII